MTYLLLGLSLSFLLICHVDLPNHVDYWILGWSTKFEHIVQSFLKRMVLCVVRS